MLTKKARRKVAQNLIMDGFSIEQVSKNTELSREEVEKIAARLGKKIA